MHRTADQALRAELAHLHRVFSCVTRQVAQLTSVVGELRTATLAAEPILLRGGLELTADQWLRVSLDPHHGRWRCDVTAYAYAFDENGRELIAFHWNPADRPGPHVHVRCAGGRLTKAHIPTGGPVALASVLAFAIRDLGVEPLRDDWQTILTETD